MPSGVNPDNHSGTDVSGSFEARTIAVSKLACGVYTSSMSAVHGDPHYFANILSCPDDRVFRDSIAFLPRNA